MPVIVAVLHLKIPQSTRVPIAFGVENVIICISLQGYCLNHPLGLLVDYCYAGSTFIDPIHLHKIPIKANLSKMSDFFVRSMGCNQAVKQNH